MWHIIPMISYHMIDYDIYNDKHEKIKYIACTKYNMTLANTSHAILFIINAHVFLDYYYVHGLRLDKLMPCLDHLRPISPWSP